jgi:hypothetical protein
MIKSNLPIPFLYRLRLRDRSGRSEAEGTLLEFRFAASSRHVRRSQAGRRPARMCTSELFLKEFIREYERFTGVMCTAAMSGCGVRCEKEYVKARGWFISHYYRIAPTLRPFFLELQDDADRACSISLRDYAGQMRSIDPLEQLFVFQTLKELLSSDDGSLLPRMEKLSEAVYRCMEEIKH